MTLYFLQCSLPILLKLDVKEPTNPKCTIYSASVSFQAIYILAYPFCFAYIFKMSFLKQWTKFLRQSRSAQD